MKAQLIKSEKVSADVKSLTFVPEKPIAFRAGQYFELKPQTKAKKNVILNVSEGSNKLDSSPAVQNDKLDADRPYSVVSAAGEKNLEFAVQLLENGEVSPKLWELKAGDSIELRGPWGDEFIWTPDMAGPFFLIGGGSGVAPLISIIRSNINQEIFVLASYKDEVHAPYAKEIGRVEHQIIYTNKQPRIEQGLIEKNLKSFKINPRIYVSGSTPFVESITQFLMVLGVESDLIFSERFGGRIYE